MYEDTLLEKLNYLLETKNLIYQAIKDIGSDTITTDTLFRDYANEILTIHNNIKDICEDLDIIVYGTDRDYTNPTYLDVLPYVEALSNNKDKLVENLNVMGVPCDVSSSFIDLINKILEISSGSNTKGAYLVNSIDELEGITDAKENDVAIVYDLSSRSPITNNFIKGTIYFPDSIVLDQSRIPSYWSNSSYLEVVNNDTLLQRVVSRWVLTPGDPNYGTITITCFTHNYQTSSLDVVEFQYHLTKPDENTYLFTKDESGLKLYEFKENVTEKGLYDNSGISKEVLLVATPDFSIYRYYRSLEGNLSWNYLDIGFVQETLNVLDGKYYDSLGSHTGNLRSGDSNPYKALTTKCNILVNTAKADKLDYFIMNIGNVTPIQLQGLCYLLDTSECTSFQRTFTPPTLAAVNKINTLDLSNFDTSNATNMNNMFYNYSLSNHLNLSSFDTSNVTTMKEMFSGCKIENLDLTNFNTSNVTNMNRMFLDFGGDTTIPNTTAWEGNLDLSSFDTSSVTNMYGMFSHSPIDSIDVSSFDTSNVTDFGYMFYNCTFLKHLDLSNFTISPEVTSLSSMIACGNQYNQNLLSVDVSSFDTSNITDFSGMFAGNKKLTHLDLSNFDISSATTMSTMFNWCSSLEVLDIRNFTFPDGVQTGYMFGFNSEGYHVPLDCRIIVKDQAAKNKVLSIGQADGLIFTNVVIAS